MAKKMKKFLAMAMVLSLCIAMLAVPVSAAGKGKDKKPSNNQYEWYQVFLQGIKIAEGAGKTGNVYFLGTHYKAGVDISGSTVTWYINPIGGSSGNFGGTVNLNDYITIPDGYTVKEFEVVESSISSSASPSRPSTTKTATSLSFPIPLRPPSPSFTTTTPKTSTPAKLLKTAPYPATSPQWKAMPSQQPPLLPTRATPTSRPPMPPL